MINCVDLIIMSSLHFGRENKRLSTSPWLRRFVYASEGMRNLRTAPILGHGRADICRSSITCLRWDTSIISLALKEGFRQLEMDNGNGKRVRSPAVTSSHQQLYEPKDHTPGSPYRSSLLTSISSVSTCVNGKLDLTEEDALQYSGFYIFRDGGDEIACSMKHLMRGPDPP